eukprot:5986550-Prymnesium_polylepis.1
MLYLNTENVGRSVSSPASSPLRPSRLVKYGIGPSLTRLRLTLSMLAAMPASPHAPHWIDVPGSPIARRWRAMPSSI